MTPEDEGVEEKALMLCFRCKSLPQAPEFGPWTPTVLWEVTEPLELGPTYKSWVSGKQT